MAISNLRKNARILFSLSFALGMLNSCIVAPDTYQGNGTWVRPDGSTYQAAPPVRVVAVELTRKARIFEMTRTIQDQDKDAQGQIVDRQRSNSIINMNFSTTVVLENGERYIVNFTAAGAPGETQYVSDSFTGRNGYKYVVSGNLRVSRSPTNFNTRVTTKGLPTWQGSVTIR